MPLLNKQYWCLSTLICHTSNITVVLSCQPMGYSLEIFWIYSFKIWDFQVKLLAKRGSTVWQVKCKKFVFWCEGHTRWHPPLSRSDTWNTYMIGFFLQDRNTTLHILYPGDNCSSNPHINPHLRSLLLLPWARELKCVQWTLFYYQLMHTTLKNAELLKHSKLDKNVPTSFSLHRNHLQGAKVSAWLKITHLVNSTV